MDNDAQTLQQLEEMLKILRTNRPDERSQRSRIYAVCITLMEQAIGYFMMAMFRKTKVSRNPPQPVLLLQRE